MNRAWRLRAGPGALIVLAHLAFLIVLLRYAGTPSPRDEVPAAAYIAFTLVPASVGPVRMEAKAVPPPATSRKRTAAIRRDQPAQPAAVHAPAASQSAAQEGEPEPAALEGNRLDMDALRAAARRVEQERVPTAPERLRESEQMRSEDDSALARGIQRAKRPDCRTAYGGGTKLNLIMLIPLAMDTIRDKGCKW
jgi:hypothetical protein